MSKIQTITDQLMQQQSKNHIVTKLSQIRSQDQSLFVNLISELKNNLLNQPQYKITIPKLYILQAICQLDSSLDLLCFKASTIYQLVAVCQGYILSGLDVKGNFSRNLKRSQAFWGISNIQNIYSALISKSSPTIGLSIELQCKKYLWEFIKKNQELFPTNFDIYQYAIKHMLMLRCDRKPETQIFNLILQILQKYQYNEQAVRRNFRFMLQFFRTSLTEKQIGYLPQLSVLNITKGYSNYKVDSLFAIGSLGLSWSQSDVHNCINNVLKLGITENSYRLLKAFIQMFKNAKKYHELVQSFQKNLSKAFVFLKFPQLYQPSLKTLKQFILGPWNVTNLYNLFVPKALQFSKLKNGALNHDFIILLACVADKYKQTTLITELQEIIKANVKQQISPQDIRRQLLEYDWKIFESIKQSANKEKCNTGVINQLRGIVNIGNSCYMNSFLQCLFMTKQYRRKVLEVSTLNVQKEVLTKLQNLYTDKNRQGKNLALIARETVRPLAQLQRTFSLLLKSNRSAINPTNIRNISPVQFRNSHQHDSIQFGRFLIQTISRSIQHVFQGQMTTQIECPYCGAKRQKRENFLDLMLGNSNEDVESIETMLKISLQDEYIQNLVCQSCHNRAITMHENQIKIEVKQGGQFQMDQQPSQSQPMQQQKPNIEQIKQKQIENQKEKEKEQKQKQKEKQEVSSVKSVKRHWISRPPSYTILTLKRFEYNLKQNKNIKKQYKINFQKGEYFNLGQKQYLIYSFIVHRGVSANSGHYFVFARISLQEESKEWVCFNDSVVTKLADFGKVLEFLSSNQQDTPYIIFAIQRTYCLQNVKKLQSPITLRQPLQNFVEKDDNQYIKSLSNKNSAGGIDFSKLKFATGNYFKKDDEDDPFNNGGMGGMGNNPIM